MRLNFMINDDEMDILNNWIAEHDETCKIRDTRTAIGGRLTYSVTPTSIGDMWSVKCACGCEVFLSRFM